MIVSSYEYSFLSLLMPKKVSPVPGSYMFLCIGYNSYTSSGGYFGIILDNPLKSNLELTKPEGLELQNKKAAALLLQRLMNNNIKNYYLKSYLRNEK